MLPCPKCGTRTRFWLIAVIDVDDQPDWRDQILDRTLSREACENCGTLFRNQPSFAFFDRAHDLWIGAFPSERRDEWRESEQQAQSRYDIYFQADTSMSARMHEAPLNRRVTFGWEALREKIVAARHGLDDVSLELLKHDIGPPQTGRTDESSDLRLLDADATQLTLARVMPRTDEIVEPMAIPLARYHAARDAPVHARLRDELSQGMYVDVRRLITDHNRRG